MRRRLKPDLFQPVTTVEHGPMRINDIWSQREIDVLRQQERDKTLHNGVADVAVYQIQSEPVLHAGLRNAVYRQTIEHFSERLPAPIVRRFVDATFNRERQIREEQAAQRRAMPQRRRGRPPSWLLPPAPRAS